MKNKNILYVIVAVIVITALWYVFGGQLSSNDASSAQGEVTTSLGDIQTTGDASSSDYVVNTIPLDSQGSFPAPPGLSRAIVLPENIDPALGKIYTDKINADVATLVGDPHNLATWIDLGGLRKVIEDYEGAAEAWDYAGILAPQNSTSFHNLGDLYAYYLHDNIKAEENFLKSVENASATDTFVYADAATFYRDVMKDKAKGVAVIEEGIQKNPSSQELKDLLESFKNN